MDAAAHLERSRQRSRESAAVVNAGPYLNRKDFGGVMYDDKRPATMRDVLDVSVGVTVSMLFAVILFGLMAWWVSVTNERIDALEAQVNPPAERAEP